MEITRFSILLIAVCAPLVWGCSQDAVMNCVSGASEIGELAQNVTTNPENVQKLCTKLEEFKACFVNAVSGCSADMKQSMEALTQQFAMVDEMCDANNPCSMLKLLSCAEGFPMTMTEEQQQNMDYKQICAKLPTTMTCFETMKNNCPNSPFASAINGASNGLPTMDTECKKMYGEDYASKQGGTDDGRNSGSVLMYSFFAFFFTLMAAIVF